MRTIVDLPPNQIEALDALCRAENISRAEAVRRAVAAHLQREVPAAATAAFGLWRDRGESALEYESRIRREWAGVSPEPAAPARKPRR
jgi:hypothetical protein